MKLSIAAVIGIVVVLVLAFLKPMRGWVHSSGYDTGFVTPVETMFLIAVGVVVLRSCLPPKSPPTQPGR